MRVARGMRRGRGIGFGRRMDNEWVVLADKKNNLWVIGSGVGLG